MRENTKHLAAAFFTCFIISALAAPIVPTICGGAVAMAAEFSSTSPRYVAQDDDVPSDENDVAPQDVDKYIKVYKAMQQDRNLTVEQASAQQGLSVPQFRSLEDKIERNDALREHVRDALKPKAAASPSK
jgi:hypothetical protein